MKKLLIILAVHILFFISSCDNQDKPLPASSGNTSEILVIIENEQWNDTVGGTIRRIFLKDQYGLPQQESIFDVAHIPASAFQKLFQTHRNILILEKNKTEKQGIEIRRNVFSYPQIIVKIIAREDSAIVNALFKNESTLVDLFKEAERERLINVFSRTADRAIMARLNRDYAINLQVPEGYYMATNTEDFVWLRRETEETSLGILIHTTPYTDTNVFTLNKIITKQDSLMKQYLPGQIKDSYMTTEKKHLMPIMQRISFKNKFAIETRGLWRMMGDFMGGPFINYTLVDEENNRLITLIGFVYAPKFEKRNYLLQTEALIYSTEFVKISK